MVVNIFKVCSIDVTAIPVFKLHDTVIQTTQCTVDDAGTTDTDPSPHNTAPDAPFDIQKREASSFASPVPVPRSCMGHQARHTEAC